MFVNKNNSYRVLLLLLVLFFCAICSSEKKVQRCTFCDRRFVFHFGVLRPVQKGFPCPIGKAQFRCRPSEEEVMIDSADACPPAHRMLNALRFELKRNKVLLD